MHAIFCHRPAAAAVGAFVAASGLLLTALAVPAQSAFPGRNGKIAFTIRADAAANGEIYTMNADGTGQTNRTNDAAHDIQPTWSYDGSSIAFTSDRDGNYEIYTMNADGTHPTRRTNNAAQDQEPTWAPDSRYFAFQTLRDGNNEIYTMHRDGFDVTNLTTNAASDEQPAWSPDGRKILFVSDRDGNKEIYTMNADGTGQTRLTVGGTVVDEQPAWSPDGTKIAFQSNRDFGNVEIYTMNADGTAQTNRTNNAGTPNAALDAVPAWSPDGTKIAFVSFRDGNNEIYTMNADGTGQTRRTNSPSLDTLPDWQPLSYQHPTFYEPGAISVSLVPVMRQTISAAQCSARGGTPTTHAAPFAVTSCDPPTPVVGTSAYFGSEGAGSAYLDPVQGKPTTLVDEADYRFSASLSDIRTGSLEGADYIPDLRLVVKLRISDKLNCAQPCSGPYYRPGTATDLDFGVPIDCTATADPWLGAQCSVDTTADAVTPGAITETRQTVISVNRVRVNDAGLDMISGNADDKLFAQQGSFIP